MIIITVKQTFIVSIMALGQDTKKPELQTRSTIC